jgi:hypothetical protein
MTRAAAGNPVLEYGYSRSATDWAAKQKTGYESNDH